MLRRRICIALAVLALLAVPVAMNVMAARNDARVSAKAPIGIKKMVRELDERQDLIQRDLVEGCRQGMRAEEEGKK